MIEDTAIAINITVDIRERNTEDQTIIDRRVDTNYGTIAVRIITSNTAFFVMTAVQLM